MAVYSATCWHLADAEATPKEHLTSFCWLGCTGSAQHTAIAALQGAAAPAAAAAAASHLLALDAVSDAVSELVFQLLKLLTKRI
jgi:hypothetical protein